MPYINQCFDVVTLDQAKHVVLSNDPNDPEKFDRETEFLVNVIKDQNIINSDATVLDFGCGMGRVSKEMIRQFDCNVIGIDISPSMLTFAKIYVSSFKKFKTTTSYNIKNSIDVVLSILCLQHVENPQQDIDNLIDTLKPNGVFVLLNEPNRWIPSGIKDGYIEWSDDGFNVFEYIGSKLEKINQVQYMQGKMNIIFYRKTV